MAELERGASQGFASAVQPPRRRAPAVVFTSSAAGKAVVVSSGASATPRDGTEGHPSPSYDGPPIAEASQYRQPESSTHPSPGQVGSWKHQIAELECAAAQGFASAVQPEDGVGEGHASPSYDGPPIAEASQYRQPESSMHPSPGQARSSKHQMAELERGASQGFASAVQPPRRRAPAVVFTSSAAGKAVVVSSGASATPRDGTEGHPSPSYDGPPIAEASQYRQPESSTHPSPGQV